MAEYKSNSHKSKQNAVPEKKVEKVVTGKVIVKNRSLGQKFADTFLSEDISNVKNYAIHEVIIPGLKDAFLDCMSMLLNGTTRRSSNSRTGSSYNYGGFFKTSSSKSSAPKTYQLQNDGYNYKTIILDSKGDAEYILDTLLAEIDQYNRAFVSDLYQMVGISGTFIDTQYGWENLAAAKIKRVPEGYFLDLPKAVKLE